MRYFQRYPDATRMNHWAVALLFICAGLSGLAFFHPFFFPLSVFFGGGSWTRILHPFFGVLMCIGFALLFLQVWRVAEDEAREAYAEWRDHGGREPYLRYRAAADRADAALDGLRSGAQ